MSTSSPIVLSLSQRRKWWRLTAAGDWKMARGIARSVTGAPSGLRDIMNLELWKESLNQLHAVSRAQLGMQREPSVKTFHSPRRILEALRVEW